MDKQLEAACAALDTLASTLVSTWGPDATICEGIGWFGPALTKHDLASLATTLATDIRSTQIDAIPSHLQNLVADLPRRLQLLQANTLPQMFNGNAGQAIPAYVSTIQFIRASVLPGIGWLTLPDQRALPTNVARRARAAQAELDQLAPSLEQLSRQVKDIQAAHAVADNLPIDLQALAEAREKLSKSSTEAALTEEKIKRAWLDADRYSNSAKASSEEAQKLIQQCEAAYQITTTKGLAGAFDQRAEKLAWSMWTWVIGLVSALAIGSLIGAHRLEVLSTALQAPNPSWGGITLQAVLSLLSVGAPLWFAWLATKQIGQRFRLAEDYAFKASIAKAYEGYRKEAARIDPDFEHRLFGSALTRLDEAPLRLVESGSHGSPWHELANSDALRRAFDAAPELRDKMFELARDGIATVSKNMPSLGRKQVGDDVK